MRTALARSLPGSLAVGVVLALLLAAMIAPAASASSAPAPLASTPVPSLTALASGSRTLVPTTGDTTFASAVAVPYTGAVSVFVTFDLANQSRLTALLDGLSDPSSPEYHQYISASEFTEEFSPSASLYQLADAYFGSAAGVHVTTYANRIGLLIEGSAGVVGGLFGIRFSAGTSASTGPSYAPVGAPSLPEYLAAQVSSVDGLSNDQPDRSATVASLPVGPAPASSARPDGYPEPTDCASGGSQCFYASDLQVAYDEQSLLSITYPTQEVVATILWAGQNSLGEPVGPYDPSDIYDYYNSSLPSGEPHSTVYPVPFDGAPLPGPSASTDTTGAVGENTLDLEMVGSTAPGSAIYNVYGSGPGSAETDAALAFTLSPTGYPGLDNVSVISNSWGTLDENDSAWVPLLEEAQSRGITVLAATGDAGDDPASDSSVGSQVEFPSVMAYNSFGVTAVGGTTLTLNSDPGSPAYLSIESQVAWYVPGASGSSADTIGSSGGVSSYFAEPSWQQDTEANSVIAAMGSSGRGVPDIAAVAENVFTLQTGPSGQLTYIESGTSVSTPVEAGLVAEANAVLSRYHEPSVGYLNPTVYSWANEMIQPPASSGPENGSVVYGSYDSSLPMLPVYDVTQGSNYVYSALPGYDLVTGWGSLDAYNFTAFALSYNYSGSPFALGGVSDTVDLTGLAVTSVFQNSTVNSEYNASIEQTVFLANSLGAPIYWIENAVDLEGSAALGWQVTESGSAYYPFYGLYPDLTIWEYRISSGGIATLPATWTLTTSLVRPTGGEPEIAFDVNGRSVAIPVPAAEFIIGGSGYQYFWQGSQYTDGPYPNTPAPGGLAPEFGLLGGPAGGVGMFGTATAATVSPSYLLTGASSYVAPLGAGVVNSTIAQSTESAENLAWSPQGAGWSVHYSEGAVDQGFFIYASAEAGNPVDFRQAAFAVVFNETGLPSGAVWSVTLGGISESTSTSMLTFEMLNGSYSFSVPSVDGSAASPGSGSLSVSGQPSALTLTFTATCSGLNCAFSFIPGGWAIYAILALVAAGVIALIAVVAVRRPRRPAGPAAPVEPTVPPYNPR